MTPSRRPTSARLVPAAALLALLPTACVSDDPQQHADLPDVQIAAPAPADSTPVNLAGLHNVVTYTDDLVCGGVPEGTEGLRTLAAMGVRTVVSVDGTTPDVAAAEALGLRYVHLPISYDTVTPERQLQLAQAIANLERPIYMHCHHGKHRSAAALGTALVAAGEMDADAVVARMHVSGTADSYEGLWAAVRTAKPLSAEQLRADPASFPSITKVSGMVATMAEIDQVIDLVKQAHEAGWRAPADHPDLVAHKETKRLANLFASLRRDPESQQYPADYQRRLDESIDLSARLDSAVRQSDADTAAGLVTAIGESCKQCHGIYRN